MAKIKISSKEAMHRLDTGTGVFELEVKRKKDGSVLESVAIIEVPDQEVESLKAMGEKAGFTVSKAK